MRAPAHGASPANWPDSAKAREWARSWRGVLLDSGVSAPAELRGLQAETYQLERVRLLELDIPGADPNKRVSGRTLVAVLEALGNWYGVEGPYAWVPLRDLAAGTARDERTIRRAIARLNDLELVTTRLWWDASSGSRLPSRHYFPQLWHGPIPAGAVRAERRRVGDRWRYVAAVENEPLW